MRTFSHDEDLTRAGFGTFREQIGLDQTGDLRVQRNASLLVTLANDAHPSAGYNHVAHLHAQHFGRTQTAQEDQPGNSAVAQRAEASQECLGFARLESAWQTSRLA